MRRFLYLALLCALLGSCSMDEMDEDISDPIPIAPEFLAGKVISEMEIEFEFTSPVKVTFLAFYPDLSVGSVEDGSTVKVYLEEGLEPGEQVVASLFAGDEWGNWVSVLIPLELWESEIHDYDPNPEPLLQAAQFLAYNVISEREIEFEFTSPVIFQSLSFDLDLEFDSVVNQNIVKVYFEEDLRPGIQVEAELVVEDDWGNEITVLDSFFTRNNRAPRLLINELFTEYVSSSSKTEFIEFRILEDGNLGALKVFVMSNSRNPMIYQFPSVEVKEDEYVVLHLRKLNPLSVDELGDDLEESPGAFASPIARDFWIPGSTKLLRRTDAVYVMDQDGNVLSAVMISATPDDWWKDARLAEAADFLFHQGAWTSSSGEVCTPIEAVSTVGITNTKSISRIEAADDTNTAADWYVTGTSNASPGKPNI